MKPRGSVRGRFGGFAVGHLAVSFLCLVLLLFAGMSGGSYAVPLLSAASMLLYVPAGYAVSRFRCWPVPGRWNGIKAVLYPALCAWAWAFGGLFLLFFRGDSVSVLSYAGFFLLLSTFYLATPSCLLVMLTMILSLDGALPWLWAAGIVAAGLLPPLLFFLGSLLPSRLIGVEPAPPPELPKSG